MDSPRWHAIHVLTRFDKTGDQLKRIRDKYCIKHQISGFERQRLTALTNDIVRWRGRLDHWLLSLMDKAHKKIQPILMNILRAGLYEIIMDDKTPAYATVNAYVEIAKKIKGLHASKFANAVLRKATSLDPQSKPENCELYNWHSMPHWLWDKWKDQFGEGKSGVLIDYFNSIPKIDIRRNNKTFTHDELKLFCDDNDIDFDQPDSSEIFYRVNRNLAQMKQLLTDGKISVQDRAAGMVVELLDPKPGETIMDVCAAPGTKAVYLAELMAGDGQLIVSDINQDRLNNFESVYENVSIIIKDATSDEFPQADAILIDVPCSGTGVLGKKPDIRWRRIKSEIEEFVELQSNILRHMSLFVKPNGRIIYSTCTMEPEENWGVVDAFLKLNDNFYVEKETKIIPDSWLDARGALAPFPPESKTDGMFAVKLIHGSEK